MADDEAPRTSTAGEPPTPADARRALGTARRIPAVTVDHERLARQRVVTYFTILAEWQATAGTEPTTASADLPWCQPQALRTVGDGS